MGRPSSDPESAVCSLCQRTVPAELITLHHLTPREKGGKAEHRIELCKPCHKQLHAVFSNTDLARVYPTIEALRAAPQLAGFLKWIRRQKPGRVFRTATAHAHPQAKQRGWGRRR